MKRWEVWIRTFTDDTMKTTVSAESVFGAVDEACVRFSLSRIAVKDIRVTYSRKENPV